MTQPQSDKPELTTPSKPLQNIKSIQQSLMIMKRKLSQMNKRQNENIQQIQKVFYTSIPILNKKLTQSVQQQKFLKKKRMNFSQSILKQRMTKNKQSKMIHQMEIQRNKQMMSMMKINDRNAIKQLSKKNQQYIERMKQTHVQMNKKKREFVKSRMQHSRMKVNDFRINKLQDIKRQKQQDNSMLEKKKQRMLKEMSYLMDKENLVVENVTKSDQMLQQLRFAIDKMQKMTELEFIKFRNQVKLEDPTLDGEKSFERILVAIIEAQKLKIVATSSSTTAGTKFYNSKSLYQSRSKYSSSGQLAKIV